MTKSEWKEKWLKVTSDCVKRSNRYGCGSNCGECDIWQCLERLEEIRKDGDFEDEDH